MKLKKKQEKELDNAVESGSFKSKSKVKSIKIKVFAGIMIPMLVIMIAINLGIDRTAIDMLHEAQDKQLDIITDEASRLVESHFDSYIGSVETIAVMDSVQNLMKEVEASDAKFDFKNSKNAKAVLKNIEDVYSNNEDEVLAIFVCGIKNSQIIDSAGNITDDSFVITERPWFQALEANNGKPILSGVYQDFTTGSQVVTVAVGIFDDTGKMVGAAGFDVTLDNLVTSMNGIPVGKTGYITVFDGDKNVIYDPNKDILLKSYTEVGYSENIINSIDNNKSTGTMEYELNGKLLHGAVSVLEDSKWVVVTAMSHEEFIASERTAVISVGVLFIISIVVIGVVCILLASNMTRPARKLSEAVHRLAEGELDVEVNIRSNDEIGTLADNVGQLVVRLKEYKDYIQDAENVLNQMGEGNFKFRLGKSYGGEFEALKRGLEGVQNSLSNTLFAIMDSAGQVDSSAHQLEVGAQSLANGSAEQASTIQELAATTQQLAAQSVDESTRATQLSKDFISIGKELADSNSQMTEMVKAMENITTQSAEIEKIIKTIDDIAFQTNILALNAAVEAARAGEAGKGFAVVADEVRNLASKSSEAAKSITVLIQNSIEAVDGGSQIAMSTANSIGRVASDVTEVVDSMEEFSIKYNEQSEALNQISGGIEQLTAVVTTNSATAKESAAATKVLADEVEYVKGIMGRFKLDERFHK